jgi:hypothetical protein
MRWDAFLELFCHFLQYSSSFGCWVYGNGFFQAHQEILMKLVDLIGITSIMEVCFCFLLDFASAQRRVIENEALKQSSPL